MNRLKLILKILLRVGLFVLLLLLLTAAIIQIPVVQQFLTEKLEHYLQDQFQTEVRIQAIRLKIPESIAINGVYVADDHQDTLLNVGELIINFKLNRLLQKQIQFDYIQLSEGKANLHWATDSTNIDFILQAFNAGKKVLSEPTIKNETPPWLMTFDNATLLLQGFDFQYSDESTLLTTQIGAFRGGIIQIDYQDHNYSIDQFHLSNTYGKLIIGESPDSEIDSLVSILDYNISTEHINFSNVAFEVDSPNLAFSSRINELDNNNTVFHLSSDSMMISSHKNEIIDSDFRFDRTEEDEVKGFDYNHFGLTDTNLKIQDFNYNNGDFTAQLLNFTAIDDQGFELKELKTTIDFSKDQIVLQGLSAKTTASNISSANTTIKYPFFDSSENALDQLKITSDISADSKNFSDIRYFYHELDSIAFLQQIQNQAWSLATNVKGSLTALNIILFDFNGFKTTFNAAGQIKNLTNPKALGIDLTIKKLKTNKSTIRSLIPKASLPEYIQLPNNITLTGRISGTLKDFKTTINAKTSRPEASIPTRINARASVQNATDWKNAYVNIQLDTFRTSKTDILFYIPPNTIPEYVNLPDQFSLSGQISGPVSNLNSELILLTYRDQQANQFKALGSISGLFTEEEPSFNFNLDLADINPQDIAAFLPDSLLPAYFQLPFIKKLTGILKGDVNNFKTNFKLESNTGNWTIDAALNEQKYQLDMDVVDMNPNAFFTEVYLDSTLGMSFSPLSVNMTLAGNGFNTSKSSTSNLDIIIKNKNNPSSEGLVLSAQLANQKITARASANEKEMALRSNIIVDYTSSLPKWHIDMLVDKLDLQELELSEVPFVLKGHLRGDAKGYTLDTLSGNILASDMEMLYGDRTEQVDSILIALDIDNGNNFLKITSDVLNAALKGDFQYPRMLSAIQQQYYNYWKYDYPDSLIGNTNDQFDFEFDLLRPELLEMGFVPDLQRLSPFSGTGKYDNRNQVLQFESAIPYLDYQDMLFDSLQFEVSAKNKALDYHLGVKKAQFPQSIVLERVSIFGVLQNKLLQNTFQVLDASHKQRYLLKNTLSFLEEEHLQLSFSPKQILNYKDWSVTKNNKILWANDQLAIQHWRLFTNQEAIVIKEDGEDELAISFDNFDLKTVSKLMQLKNNYIGGILNGSLSIHHPTKATAFSSQLTVDGLVVMDAQLGKLQLQAKNKKDRRIQTTVQLVGNGNELKIAGNLNLADESETMDLKMAITRLDLPAIEPLAMGYLENMEGSLSGDIDVSGSFAKPSLIGQVQFDKAALDIELLKARLQLGNQPIVFDANRVEFKDLEIRDANGNKGIMSSYILTDDYRNYSLQAEVAIKDFLVLNTTAADNDLYYGTLKVDAIARLSGNLEEPTIDITATPKQGSNLTYQYNIYSNSLETGEGIVEFISTDPDIETKRKEAYEKSLRISNDLNMNITVKIAVNENINFKAITDPISGDYFVGKGKGDLVYTQKPGGIMGLNGNLKTVEGKYLFTYQKVIRRPFDLEPGGTISWTGDPFTPKLNFNVAYKLRTSAYPLLTSQGVPEAEANAVPKQEFVVKLNIGGTPAKTALKSSIEYPKTEGNNSDVEAAINRINLDESEQNTQTFSLILFGGFTSKGQGNANLQPVDVAGSINDAITKQLNNLANSYIKFVDIDFGLDSYEENNSSTTDFKVSVRKRFFNDRLSVSLDGTTRSERSDDDTASETYLDNLIIEYLLTREGTYKMKIYSKRDFDDFIGGTGVKLGGAFVFSKEFNGIRLKNRGEK